MSAHDVARAGALVRLPVARTFEPLMADIDRWWQRGPAWRARRASVLHLEPLVGGRLFEAFDGAGDAGPRVVRTGEVLV